MTSAVADAPRARRGPARLVGLRPAEGLPLVALHLTVVLTAAWAIEGADWADGMASLPLLAAGGALLGLALAKTAAPDMAAHTVAFVLGAGAAVAQTAATSDRLDGGWRDRLLQLWERADRWQGATARGEGRDDSVLFVCLMGLTVWLVAYMSAWTLYRRRWLTAAVLLPGFVILINLGYQDGADTTPLLAYTLAACALAGAHYGYRRRLEWVRAGTPYPPSLPWRFLAVALNVALLVTVLAWTLPLSARGQLAAAVWDRIERPWEAFAERWEETFDDFGGSSGDGPATYSAFGDEFELGGELDLSDAEVVVLRADEPAYLVARRYDAWDGRGWRSAVEETFEERGPNGKRYSSQMTFEAGQAVGLSGGVTVAREATEGTVVVVAPKGDLLLTLDTFRQVDRPTSVQLSWLPVEATYRLDDDEPDPIPGDVLRLVRLLERAPLTETDGDGPPLPADGELASQIVTARADLLGRFLATDWTAGPAGTVSTLSVRGQVPVYDDVEAVYGRQAPVSGDQYRVTGLTSTASPADLRGASADYPPAVADRYLQLPDTVTDRTRDLARDLTSDTNNAYDAAKAVEAYLREAITYNERIPDPPDGVDLVDHVLFERPEGYCEYYASAMTVLLRERGIPARVVTGFFPVADDDGSGAYVYRERNAHAWVEVFFPGYGWIPFEPTAARPDIQHGADRPFAVPTPTPTPPAPRPTPTPPATPADDPAAATPVPPPAAGSDDALLDRARGPVGLAGLALALATLGGALVLAAAWRRGLGGLTPAAGLWARALKLGRWWGVRADPSMTPREYAGELGRAVPAARAPAEAVADLYAAEAYGGRPVGASGPAAWRQLRRAVLRTRPRRG